MDVAQLVEWLLPTPEIRVSNLVMGIFYRTFANLLSTVLK